MRLKVGVSNPRALLISLRERLAPHVELVDLAGLDADRMADHPLFGFDNVVISPHIAGITLESFAQKENRQAEAVLAVCRGEVPQSVNVLNPKAAEAFRERFGGG